MSAGVYCGQLDISNISEDELIANPGEGAWVGFDVDERIYEVPGSIFGNVIIRFNNPCWATPCQNDSTALVGQSFLMIANSLNTTLKTATENSSTTNQNRNPASNVCGVDAELLRQVQETVDSLQANEKGFQPAAIVPIACVIPMKSNMFSYGPWASNNFSTTYGGAEITVDNNLSPWLFGSLSSTNIAGQELANTSVVGLSRAEKGSVTLLTLPEYTLGAAIANGPVLSNISVSFGSNGVTTTYDFSTYTPKFGQVSRAIIEKYKTINKIRNEQLRFLRQNAILNTKIQNKRNLNTYNRTNELSKSISDKNSMGRVLVGEIFDFQETLNNEVGQRTIVGMTTLSKSSLEMRGSGYFKKGFMSLDGLYGPVSISGDGNLPRFISTSGNITKGWPTAPQPPFMTEETEEDIQNIQNLGASDINEKSEIISIHKNYLNPLANPNSIPYHEGQNAGHCIDMVGRNTIDNGQNGLITNFYQNNQTDKYSNDYRFLGMRGPLVLHSWGYDTEGKPVPNEADTENNAAAGVFQAGNLTNRFLSDWLQKPKTWPVAPIDLRLDRDRGVWVSPREYKIIVLELLEDINAYQKGKAKIINYGIPLTDNDGNIVSDNNFIIVEDRLGVDYKTGCRYYGYFDTSSSTYLLMAGEGGCGVKIARTEGLWPINTIKAIDILDIADVDMEFSPFINIDAGSKIIETGVMCANFIKNIANTDRYIILVSKINDHYIYINGNEC